ncbi:MAG: hypothetical protein AAGD96_25190, partial [Chloroflexota bacterium]
AKEKKAAAPFWIGCLIGLALLSKISGLALGAVVAWVLLWQLFEGRHFGSVIKDGLILTAGVLTTAGWWLWRNQTLYGDPLGFGALRFAHSGTYRDESLSAAETLSESTLLLKTFWLFPGNGTLFGPNWFYWIVNLLVLFGLLSLAILWSKSSPKVASQGKVLSPLIVWLVIILLLLFYWISTVGATSQGRLMYPALSALAVLVMMGFFKLGETGVWLSRIFVFFLAGAAVFTPSLVIGQEFYRYEAAPLVDYPNNSDGYNPIANIGLLGYELISPMLNVGDKPKLKLYWESAERVEKSFFYIVHFVDSAGVEVSRYEGYPGGGNYPTLAWEPDNPFVEQVTLSPIADNAAAGAATILIELIEWNGETKTEQRPLSQRAKVRGNLELDNFEADGTVGQLAEIDLLSTQNESNQLVVDLNWRVLAPTPTDYTVFAHLIDKAGNLVSQGDSQPVGGRFPTSLWEADEFIQDRYTVSLDGVPSGDYSLAVGVYDPTSGGRLSIVDQDNNVSDHLKIDISLP